MSATCYVLGPLSAVSGFIATSNAKTVTISWTAPFSLDLTDIDPDVQYILNCYDVTEETVRLIPCEDCHNINTTQYKFTPNHTSPCHKYFFSVIPRNGAGEGESSINITGYTLNGK